MKAYYNEIDPYCAQWLRNLISAGLIAGGDVDERDIRDVAPADLAGYAQCHFFAGIGGWSAALRLAAVPDRFPLWTGSCPCQPFSQAGKSRGFADERHLWPYWFQHIRVCRPAIVLGEQVASKAGLAWYDLVSSDLEGEGYACGAADLCAAGVGAPHIRQRLWWVAYAESQHDGSGHAGPRWRPQPANGGNPRVVGVAHDARLSQRGSDGRVQREAMGASEGEAAERASNARGAVNASSRRNIGQHFPTGLFQQFVGRGKTDFWSVAQWIPCSDGKQRPAQPGIFPLSDGVSARVAKLRVIGNSIVPQVAAEFIRAVM